MARKKKLRILKFTGRFCSELIKQVEKEYPEIRKLDQKINIGKNGHDYKHNALHTMVYFELTNCYFNIKDNEIHLTREKGIIPLKKMPVVEYNHFALRRYEVIELKEHEYKAVIRTFNGGQLTKQILRNTEFDGVRFALEVGDKVWAFVDTFNNYSIAHFEIEEKQEKKNELKNYITMFPG
jgi:hypothetical protein